MNVALITTLALLSGSVTSDTHPTPAELQLERTLTSISSRPDRYQTYNALALAFARRARETADPSFYERGHGALSVSLALEPDNLGAKRTRTWLLLGQHRFEEALELAAELNRQVPDDLGVYGFLVDAHVELGNYTAAEEACQWMLDMRPGNIPGLTRAAYLRELFGDVGGALELMGQAYQRLPLGETEDRAWILVQMSHLHRSVGEIDSAVALAEAADALFPDYHYALAELAHVRADQGRHADAVALLRRRHELAPHPENLFDVAVALERGGEGVEARALFERFEAEALEESKGLDNANRELIAYYLEHAEGRASDGLRLAERERARRRDVHTREIYAWALLEDGRTAEAQEEIQAALDVGLRSARTHLIAGRIAAACDDVSAATAHFEACDRLRPSSEEARRAAAHLAQLAPQQDV